MATATRQLDVWIVDLNKVYTGVPFTVVTDWLQQGRLLASDRVRLAGKQTWHPVENVPALTPYLPTPTPIAADDRAEAEAPIDLGFEPARVREEEDDDVDMIPLIDVSLVLLIFFMMTTAISEGVFSPIATPTAKHQLATIGNDAFWIGIDRKIDSETKEKYPEFSLGKDSDRKGYLVRPTANGKEIVDRLTNELKSFQGEVKIRLRAEKTMPIETIKAITIDLQDIEAKVNQDRDAKKRVQIVVVGEVSEPMR